MERAEDAAFEDRPEAFDLRVNSTYNILLFGMIDNGMRIISKVLIANPLIGAEQTYFVRDHLPNEGFKRLGLNVSDNAGRRHYPCCWRGAHFVKFLPSVLDTRP
jgi:hypothetical protein